jgi:Zn-finger nucleic acid-binding protein
VILRLPIAAEQQGRTRGHYVDVRPSSRRLQPRNEALPCPSCNAITPLSSGECGSCNEALFTTTCSCCGETLFAGHEFCVTCGRPIDAKHERAPDWAEGTPPAAVIFDPDASDAPTRTAIVVAREPVGYCPRCRGRLEPRAIGSVDLDGCAECGGAFVAAPALSALVHDRPSALALATELASRVVLSPARPLRGSCPVCSRALAARVVGRLGARAHVCTAHGAWFEREELLRTARVVGDGKLAGPAATEILAFLLA